MKYLSLPTVINNSRDWFECNHRKFMRIPFSLKLILAAESTNVSPPTWCHLQRGTSPSENDLSSSQANSGSGSEHERTDAPPVALPRRKKNIKVVGDKIL